MPRKQTKPILGQEAVCADGLGRVIDYSTNTSGRVLTVKIQTYVNDRSCDWNPDNVELVPIPRFKMGS